MKVYRRHNCNQPHNSWLSAARCIWPFATIWGDGPYAVCSRCIPGRCEVTLYPTLEAAQRCKRGLDPWCCGSCEGGHDVIILTRNLVLA